MAVSDTAITNSSTRHVIEAMMLIAQSPHPLGLSEIADAMDLPQSTAHRALMTLEESGFAKREGHSAKLVAGEVVHHLIRSMIGLFPARALLAGQIRQVSREVDVTVSLNWRVGWHSLRLSSYEGSRESYQLRRVGEARPLHSGIGPKTILAALGPNDINAYLDWWRQAQIPGDIDTPDAAELAAIARAVAQDGKVFRDPSDYSALVWAGYPLRGGAGAVSGSLSIGMAPAQSKDAAFLAGLDRRVDGISAGLLAAGEEAASPFDRLPPELIQLDQLKVLRLVSEDV